MIVNRQRLMVAAVLVLIPAVAFPWASVAPYEETHQYIVKTALGRLQADPAFSANSFPGSQQVEDYEGARSENGRLTGNGADASGKSQYSQHYYNPELPGQDKGQAPEAVKENFSTLAQDNLSGSKSTPGNGPETAAHSAAYSAHFLADIFCPYHVNGVPRAIANEIWKDQVTGALSDRKRTVYLPGSITGSDVLAYLTPFKGLSHNWYTELSRFETLTSKEEFDWFDPWYYNGDTTVYGSYYISSSHIAFEARPTGALSPEAFHQAAGQGADGYDPHWKNATPVFDSPWVGQSEQARQFTIFKATETRDRQEAYFNNPVLPLRDTIRAVYTLWRASISGLRPAIEFQPEGGDSTAYRVTAKVTNAASSPASDIRARLSVFNCSLPGNDKEKEVVKSLAAAQATQTSWKVEPIAGKACNIKLEVIGAYTIPDIQYAHVERVFFPDSKSSASHRTASSTDQPATSNPSANTGGGHWERGAATVVWPNGPPTDAKSGSKVGDPPSAGETWISGPDFDHQWNNTVESMGENQFAYHSFALANPKGFDNHDTGSWTLPPTTLTPGQKFIMQVTSGTTGGGSCYAWRGEETRNIHLINTTGPNQTVTAEPYTIPDGSPNAQFGFFCGTSILRWDYTYHWVGGGATHP